MIRMPRFLGTFNRTDQEDPLKAFRYLIEIDNFVRFGFSKMTGLKATTEEVQYREGGDNTTSKKSPGLTKFNDVTFERGVILAAGQGGFEMVSWYQQVFDVSAKTAASPGVFRRTIEVVLNDKEGNEQLRWRLKECWPKEFEPIPDLEALASNNLIEKMVIAHEGFQLLTAIT